MSIRKELLSEGNNYIFSEKLVCHNRREQLFTARQSSDGSNLNLTIKEVNTDLLVELSKLHELQRTFHLLSMFSKGLSQFVVLKRLPMQFIPHILVSEKFMNLKFGNAGKQPNLNL